TAPEIGGWLGELEDSELSAIDRDVVRLARRDWERASRVPTDLAAELSRAHSDGQETWQAARAADDFAAFAPALERNIELARAYGQCLDEEGRGIYQTLIDDFDYGLRTEDLRRLFAELAARLAPLVEEAGGRPPVAKPEVSQAVQRRAVEAIMTRVGVDAESWRLDVSTHPFSASIARTDQRMTTRYGDGGIESLLSSLHEFGHALYEHQIDPELERTNLGSGTSMSIHESQSKLWENHVARSPAFSEVLAAELATAGTPVQAPDLHAALVGVEPTLIRVSADPLTYPLHIILRFELELALIEGQLAVSELPAAWGEAMRRLLGLEVPSDASGCLQDIHWGAGSFGYFPSYAMGCLIAAQLWETMEAELGPLEEELRRGEVSAIQGWLGERVHRHGRRLDTIPLVQEATGRGLEIEPFLRYVAPLAGRP
ncbi:MAG TPA: carboxypeptidase M32, partial [Solirubrobacteraceae bacterium]